MNKNKHWAPIASPDQDSGVPGSAFYCGSVLALLLAGCGGGNATDAEIKEADAAVAQVHSMSVQPVSCAGAICR